MTHEEKLWQNVHHGQVAVSQEELGVPGAVDIKIRNQTEGPYVIYATKSEGRVWYYKWRSVYSDMIPLYYLKNLKKDGWNINY